MRAIVISMCFFIVATVSIAQGEINKSYQDSVDNYYTDLTKLLALRVNSLYRVNSIEISNDDLKLILIPNSPISLGVGVNFRGIGVAVGIGLPHSTSSINRYGKTSRFDMRGSFSGKKFAGSGYFQMYKGYYVKNPEDFMQWNKDYYPQLPDMYTFSFGASGYYIFNHKKYSNKAVTSRTQIQKKSAGSFTLGVFLNYDETDSGGSFFPSELPDSIGSDFGFSAFRYLAAGISAGYTYTWVISKSFFLNGTITPGGGYKDIRIKTDSSIVEVNRNAHVQLVLRGALGYEHKYFYAGLTASTLIRNISTDNYNINIASEQIRFFIGRRFNVSKN